MTSAADSAARPILRAGCDREQAVSVCGKTPGGEQLVIIAQLSGSAAPGKQPETANLITQADRHTAVGLKQLAQPPHGA
jgi:hypothetical protein